MNKITKACFVEKIVFKTRNRSQFRQYTLFKGIKEFVSCSQIIYLFDRPIEEFTILWFKLKPN